MHIFEAKFDKGLARNNIKIRKQTNKPEPLSIERARLRLGVMVRLDRVENLKHHDGSRPQGQEGVHKS